MNENEIIKAIMQENKWINGFYDFKDGINKFLGVI